MTDSAGRRIDAEQTKGQLAKIHDAIGRPVTKAILDRDDNVILDLGDLITHQAVQRAHENGASDGLFHPRLAWDLGLELVPFEGHFCHVDGFEHGLQHAQVLEELEQKRDELEHEPSDDQGQASADRSQSDDQPRAGDRPNAGVEQPPSSDAQVSKAKESVQTQLGGWRRRRASVATGGRATRPAATQLIPPLRN